MKPMIAVTMMALAGCATTGDAEGPPPASIGECSAEGAQGLVGRPASAELGAEALRLTGLRQLRWIPEGSAVTMDFRVDRLNIELDSRNRVSRITCG
jgi:hypothetical protein